MPDISPSPSHFQAWVARGLTAYVAMQPLVDVATGLGTQAHMSMTAGTVIRTLFVAAIFLYIFLCGPYPGRKPLLIYMGLLTGYLAVFCGWNLAVGDLAYCVKNIGEALKVFYFPYTAAFLYTLYQQQRFVVPDKVIAGASAGYCVVILLAYLTGTSFTSYNAGYGYCGWFYAANDVSILILLTAPLLLRLCLKKLAVLGKGSWKVGLTIAIVLVSLLFSASFIGTKLVYLGVLLYLGAALVWFLVRFFTSRNKAALRCLFVVVLLCAVLVGLYPISPLNAYVQDIYIPMSGEDPAAYEASLQIPGIVNKDRMKAIQKMEEAARGTWLGELIDTNPLVEKLNWLLSRRLLIIAPIAQEYVDGDLPTKLLGLGYTWREGYTKDISHLVEMEGPALLLRHGVVGFLLYYVPFLLLTAFLVVQFLRKPHKRMRDLTYCTYLYCVLMAFATSMIAGHTLETPCVSLFAALLYEKLILRTREQNRLLSKGLPLPAGQQPF